MKKTITINELEQQVKALSEENTGLKEQVEGYVGTDGTIQASDKLIEAANAYLSSEGDLLGVSNYLDEINMDELGDDCIGSIYFIAWHIDWPDRAGTVQNRL